MSYIDVSEQQIQQSNYFVILTLCLRKKVVNQQHLIKKEELIQTLTDFYYHHGLLVSSGWLWLFSALKNCAILIKLFCLWSMDARRERSSFYAMMLQTCRCCKQGGKADGGYGDDDDDGDAEGEVIRTWVRTSLGVATHNILSIKIMGRMCAFA